MSVSSKATHKVLHLVMHHSVVRYEVCKVLLLLYAGQVTVHEEVAGIKEITRRCKLLNGVAAVKQFTFVAVNIGDGGLTRSG